MVEVRAHCDDCATALVASPVQAAGGEQTALECPSCRRRYPIDAAAQRLEQCPICNFSRFFRQKAFPRALGIGLVVIGAIFVPFTYGVSLMVLALVDLIIYRRVPVMAVCYLCRAEFRGVPLPDRILPFRHHMAEGYEKRRAERQGANRRPATGRPERRPRGGGDKRP